jgi:hypothetical protein
MRSPHSSHAVSINTGTLDSLRNLRRTSKPRRHRAHFLIAIDDEHARAAFDQGGVTIARVREAARENSRGSVRRFSTRLQLIADKKCEGRRVAGVMFVEHGSPIP